MAGQLNRFNAFGAYAKGAEFGEQMRENQRVKSARNALARVYAGDESALADLMAADPEAGRQVETQIGVRKFVTPAQTVEQAGPVRPGVDAPLEPLTQPAKVDTEGLTGYLASRGDSGALKALMEKIAPKFDEWLGTNVTDAEGNVWGVSKGGGWQKLPGVKAKPDAGAMKPLDEQAIIRDGMIVKQKRDQQTGEWVDVGYSPAPTNPETKPPATSEGERNAAGFYSRAKEAGTKINALEDEGGALPTVGTDIAGMFGDYAELMAMSEKQQVYRTLAMAWIRAKLRKESGATIQPQEAEDEYRTYFPVPGDDPARIAAKRRLREIAEQELKTSAGRAIPQEQPTPTPQGGQVESQYDKYVRQFNAAKAKGDRAKMKWLTEQAIAAGVANAR